MAFVQLDQMTRGAVEAINKARNVCLETSALLLEREERVAPEHLRLMLDCSRISELSADFLLSRSPWSNDVLNLCAEACDRCAESCEQFADDPAMLNCARACRACAEACRSIISRQRVRAA